MSIDHQLYISRQIINNKTIQCLIRQVSHLSIRILPSIQDKYLLALALTAILNTAKLNKRKNKLKAKMIIIRHRNIIKTKNSSKNNQKTNIRLIRANYIDLLTNMAQMSSKKSEPFKGLNELIDTVF